jgi:hypothetical protein
MLKFVQRYQHSFVFDARPNHISKLILLAELQMLPIELVYQLTHKEGL